MFGDDFKKLQFLQTYFLEKQMKLKTLFVILSCVVATNYANAAVKDINISAIINAGYTERSPFEGVANYQLGEHAAGLSTGFWTDHSELTISSPIDDQFFGKISLAIDEHEGAVEFELEEAFIQTLSLPYDLSFRAGRFLSNVGYLNGKHAHTDSFADRPLIYRTFMNGHYYDDGARLSWLAPTDLYLELGTELFKGAKIPAYASGKGIGAHSFFAKTGGDFNIEHSWQLGFSYLGFNNDEGQCSAHHEHNEHEEHETEGHSADEHSEMINVCDFSGQQDYFIVDGVWKWAPNGNYKYQNFTFSAEYFDIQQKGELHHEEDEHHDEIRHHEFVEEEHHDAINVDHSGFYVSGVYQFTPNWAAGIRYSEITLDAPYSDGFKPSVSTAMIEWRNSHFSTVRLQYSHDKSLENETDNQITLQFVMALGAHSAHQF